MSQENPVNDAMVFGEKLLGMQSFNADRARRYRDELEKLLVHRLSKFERWALGVMAVWTAVAFTGGGIAMAAFKHHSESEPLDQARLIVAATLATVGLALGGWWMRVAIQGGYGRRRGDFVGVFITLLICGGLGYAFINMAWEFSDDPAMRLRLLLGGGTLILIMAACVIISHFQHLHRHTQEKLLRIEYHLAELMERNA